ncbi:MAG TPA: hypothetical protein VJ246_00980 [Patescibacteria group bacterium]|nr:hypothetical protein [Patescibacteria group bacterium]
MIVTKKMTAMSKADLQFSIDQLRKDKMILSLEAIMISFAAVLTAVFLPEILYRVLYANPAVKLDPELLSWIPVVSYIVAVGFTIVVGIKNTMIWSKVRMLEQQAELAKK